MGLSERCETIIMSDESESDSYIRGDTHSLNAVLTQSGLDTLLSVVKRHNYSSAVKTQTCIFAIKPPCRASFHTADSLADVGVGCNYMYKPVWRSDNISCVHVIRRSSRYKRCGCVSVERGTESNIRSRQQLDSIKLSYFILVTSHNG
jgi:hypothetical protein